MIYAKVERLKTCEIYLNTFVFSCYNKVMFDISMIFKYNNHDLPQQGWSVIFKGLGGVEPRPCRFYTERIEQMNKLGLNIHPYALGGLSRELLFERVAKLKPTSLVVLDDLVLAEELARKFTNTKVFWRRWEKGEGLLHYKDASGVFKSFEFLKDKGVGCYVGNEADGYDGKNLSKIADFYTRIGELFEKAGIDAALVNFGVGHPDKVLLHLLKPLFEIINGSKHLFLGLHEYGTHRGILYTDETRRRDVFPWRVGRFTFIKEYAQSRGLNRVRFIITEFGVDHSFYAEDDKNKGPWRDSFTDEQYAVEIFNTVRNLYDKHAEVYGVCIFSYGGNEDWKRYSVHDVPHFWSKIFSLFGNTIDERNEINTLLEQALASLRRIESETLVLKTIIERIKREL